MAEEITSISITKNDSGAPNVEVRSEALKGASLKHARLDVNTGELLVVCEPKPENIPEGWGFESEFRPR